MEWTILVGVAVLVLLFLLRRAAAYQRMFSEAHFLEIAEGMARIKPIAQEQMEAPDTIQPVTFDDPRTLKTSQNLRVFYTVTRNEHLFEHHYSVSIAHGYTSTAVGEIFSLYVAHLLGFTSQQFSIQRSQRGIYHVEWHWKPDEQAAFAHQAVKVPTREELPALREKLDEWRRNVFLQAVEIPVPDLETIKNSER